MAVISFREVLPRTLQHRFGESPSAECRYVVTVDAPTPHNDIISALGILHGSPHPEFPYLLMLDASLTETDRHHVEVTYRYEVPATDYQPNPLLRPDVWSFSSSGAAVPAMVYFDESDRRLPLINTAGDFIEGAMTEESELRATISGNRPSFPLAVAAYVTNAINSSPYLGCPAYSWKCNGIGAQQAVEIVDGVEVRYYQVTAELAYRQSGWRLLLPNVGWNCYSEAKKKKVRAYVFDDQTDEPVPSATPVALNENGSIRLSADLQGSGRPDILVRRVHRAVEFSTYFGVPNF